MPNAPKRFSPKGIVPHGQKRTDNWGHVKSAPERGYGSDWRKVRNAYIKQFPLCQPCEAAGKLTDAVQVDHIKPFKGLDDPLRLDWDNLQSVCLSCHRKAEHARRRQS